MSFSVADWRKRVQSAVGTLARGHVLPAPPQTLLMGDRTSVDTLDRPDLVCTGGHGGGVIRWYENLGL